MSGRGTDIGDDAPAEPPDTVLDFLREAGRLKDTLRSAHTAEGRQESTAEHSWRLALWIVALEEHLSDLDARRLLELAVVHDLGEALHGDTPAPLQHAEPDREARERRDLHTLTASLPAPARERLRALWEEYEACETAEARAVRALDKLETILQHQEGLNPPGFDHAFNLGYARERTDAQPLTRGLRERLDERTRQLAASGGDPRRAPPLGPPRRR